MFYGKMNALERLKSEIVGRLTDEVIIRRVDNPYDNKKWLLKYKGRAALVEESKDGFVIFFKNNGNYHWDPSDEFATDKSAVEYAKKQLKNQEVWK
jgi:hypothetical protein